MKKINGILRGELIGKYIQVKGNGIEGKIIDETKNTFLILKKNNETEMILKKNHIFELKAKDGNVEIDGSSILMRPEDRIKAKWN